MQENTPTVGGIDKVKLQASKQLILASRAKRKLFYSERPVNKKEIFNKKIILKKGEDGLLRDTSSRLRKIRKQTLFLVKLDKEYIRDRVDALRAYYHENKEKTEDRVDNNDDNEVSIHRREDIVELTITLNQPLQKVIVRPIKISLKHPIYTVEYGCKGALVLGEAEKTPEGFDSWADKEGIKIFRLKRFMEILGDAKKACRLIRSWDVLLCSDSLYDRIRKKGHRVFTKLKRLPYPVELANVRERIEELRLSIGITLHASTQFTIPVARLRMTNQYIVTNIMHAVYDSVPHVLANAEKNTQVKHISIRVGNSKLLELYRNDHLQSSK